MEWFTKEPGMAFAQSDEDPTMAILADVPDWVTLPPDLGGHRVKVLGAKTAPCPRDGTHDCKHLVLEGKVQVAECPTDGGFLWYSHKETT